VCQTDQICSHGTYPRKVFHGCSAHRISIPIRIPRYLCENPECTVCTFSVLPPNVLRYSRFVWPSLFALCKIHADGTTVYRLARHVWNVGRGVIIRAKAYLDQAEAWTIGLHQELCNGSLGHSLERMVKLVVGKIGLIEMVHRWYRHRYPARF